MKIIYAKEEGEYFLEKVFEALELNGKEAISVENYKELFNKLDLDKKSFAVVRLNNQYVCEKLLETKYKIFHETYCKGELCFASKQKQDAKAIKTAITEALIKDLYLQSIEYQTEKEFESVPSIENYIDSEGTKNLQTIYLITKTLAKESRFWVLEKIKLDLRLQYLLIGRSFFDMPSSESNKAFITLKTDKDVKNIENLLKESGFKVLSIIPSGEEDLEEKSYYIEVSFKGLLDLGQLEQVYKSINILGIIEAGEEIWV
jgi:hypothetical protein